MKNEKQKLAIEMRMEKFFSCQSIADLLDVSKSTVWRWINESLITSKDRKKIVYTPELRQKFRDGAIKGNKNRKLKKKPLHALKNVSSIRDRLFVERGRKCELCKWEEINSYHGNICVQIDHIDGNRDNNDENNLRILCPNCHSLTEHYMFYGKSHSGTWGKKGTKRFR